ncbi:hypothetical protein Clacol_001160 [Clathrus columnatus]|uniref:Phytase A n=1 Tax=Clathrus columnatus TaxID=1419009 RepID=A0AAV5A0F5_9AGAM|nr:hypothetical protein Clacol_001160 [Clathrus columnatus]
MAYTFAFLFFSVLYTFAGSQSSSNGDEKQVPYPYLEKSGFGVPKIEIPEEIIRSWAQYSPAYPLAPYDVPERCTVTQIQRHGARFPTIGAAARMATAILNAQQATAYLDPAFEFIKDWEYDLGYDDLISYGASQSFETGEETYKRYSTLVSQDNVPFVRASDGTRVVLSATNWTDGKYIHLISLGYDSENRKGFAYASSGIFIPSAPLLISESGNDTLDDKMCPNAGDSDTQTEQWQDVFAPAIVERFQKVLPGSTLTNADIPNLIALCAFDTLYKEVQSPWCGLFTLEDYWDYEYYGALDKYYNTGYGQKLGPVQGVGYVNELLARLTGTPVVDETQTNRTLDSSPITFPLDRTIYADFSHDNEMIAIYAALGIFRQPTPLDPRKRVEDRTWITSHLVPFNSKFVTERLLCDGVESVRMLLNDGVVPLNDVCNAGDDGICTLEAFVDSQSYSRNNGEGDWQECF